MFGGGIFVGRLLNMILSFAIVLLVGWGRPNDWRPVLAAVGLVCCPYFLGVSAFLYTEMIAVFFGVIGLWLHQRGRYVAAGVCLALGIASRQYMVAFPAAIATYELLRSVRTAKRLRLAWIAPVIAASTLLGWIWFFGGLAPAGALAKQSLATATLLHVRADHMLYFLTTVGAYLVIPETVLFRRWSNLTSLISVRAAVIAIVLLALFVLFPPLNNPTDYAFATMGFFDKAARLVLNDPLRMALFYACAVLASVRLSRPDLAFWALLFNALVMLKAHIAWDKYALPLLVWLWLLKSRGELDDPRSRDTIDGCLAAGPIVPRTAEGPRRRVAGGRGGN